MTGSNRNREIEQKYLVDVLPDNLEQYKKSELEQVYISTNPVIRIRKADDCCVLTVKGAGRLSREEFELDITIEQYENLFKKMEEGTVSIKKTRYYIPLNEKFTAELDVYHGFLKGLLTVEVEFENLEEAKKFAPPKWFGANVTELGEYANSALAKMSLTYSKANI